MTTIYLVVWKMTSSATIKAVRFLSGQAASCLSFLNNKFNLQVLGNVVAGNQTVIQVNPQAQAEVFTNGEDVEDLEAGGGEVDTNNFTMLGNQIVIELQDLGNVVEGNQNVIQGGDPHGRRYDVVVEYTNLAYGKQILYRLLMPLNMGIFVLLNQYKDIAPPHRDLILAASVVFSVAHAVIVVLMNRCDAFLWIDILLLTGQVLVTTANFL